MLCLVTARNRLFGKLLGMLLVVVLLPLFAGAQSADYDPPTSYYAAANGKTGAALKTALHGIIAPHTVLTYTPGVWSALEKLDADPADPSNNVILFYSGYSTPIDDQYHSGSSVGTWNREHIWCQSFFNDDAKIKTDIMNLRPADSSVNSTRSNRYYDVVAPPASTSPYAPESRYNSAAWEPRDADKGAAARAAFYMAVCYDGTGGGVSTTKLTLSDTPNSSTNTFGKLSTLLAWNRQYPVTEAERRRNQLAYSTIQRNRNPFVDDRYLADMIFGSATTPQRAWLLTRFSASELASLAVSGDAATPAGDGINNLLKYAFNLNPKVSGSSNLPVGGLAQRGNTTYLTITHRTNRQATDLGWRYQSSTNLLAWTDITPTLLGMVHLDADATDQVTVGIPATGGSQFLRAVIEKQ